MDERGEDKCWGEATSMNPWRVREGEGEGGKGGRGEEDDISYSHIRKQEAYMVSYVRVWALQASKR